MKTIRRLLLVTGFALLVPPAQAAEVNAYFASATVVPVTASSYTATGNSVNISLGFAPPVGTTLTVVNHTGLGFIAGRFSNLAQGQEIGLIFNNTTYQFVANYYGGTGNDLVLRWKHTTLTAWGDNQHGSLGNNSTTNSSVPVAVDTSDVLAGKMVVASEAGLNHSLALCSDGTVAAWGYNSSGQLGNGVAYVGYGSRVPVAVTTSGVLAGKTVVAIGAGDSHSLALCSDGTVAAWGYNYYGQLGNGSTTSRGIPVAVNTSGVLAGKTVVAIEAGSSNCLALCSDGTLAAWGYNSNGQLGNGSTTHSSVPVAVNTGGVLAGKTVIAIEAGSGHSLALCSDGRVVAWGLNNSGQLGNNSTTNSSVPVTVNNTGLLAGKTVVAIQAGYAHSLALCSDGTVAAWGSNSYGQLGNGSATNSNVPVAVNTSGLLAGKTVVAIEAGWYSHSLALCSDGTVAAWGYNSFGQLGNGSTTSSSVPVAVNTSGVLAGTTVIAVAGGRNHSLALAAGPLPPLPPASNVATLSELALSGGTLSPTFTSATTSYTASVSNATASITVTPTVTDTTATVKVNGVTIPSGTPSAAIPLTIGSNTVTILVTAQDGATTTTYTISLTRTSARLTSLALGNAVLEPGFAPDTLEYSALVLATQTSWTAVPEDPGAVLEWRLAETGTWTAFAAGVPIENNLVEGANMFEIRVTAADSTTHLYSLTLISQAPPVITTDGDLGTVGYWTAYSRQFEASGGTPPYHWAMAEDCSPPHALSLSADGRLSGKAAADGPFAIMVTDSLGLSATKQFTLHVVLPSYVIDTPNPLPAGKVGAFYQFKMYAYFPGVSSKYFRWSVVSGELPRGLSLSEDGWISGTPELGEEPTFRIHLTDHVWNKHAEKDFQLTIYQEAPIVTSAETAAGRQGVPFTYRITATQNPTSYGAAGLPGGLALDSTTGIVSGSATLAGDFTVTVSAHNGLGTGQRVVSLQIEPPLPLPVMTSAPFAAATANSPFSLQLAASNEAQSYAMRNAPPWMTLDQQSGVLSGTPTVPGTVTVEVRASNTTGPGVWTLLNITVSPHPDAPIVTNLAEARGRKNDAFSFQITAAPAATLFAATGALPPGIVLDPVTGLLTGTPTVEGTFNLTLTANNAAGQSMATPFRIVLGPARQVPVITGATFFTANAGSVFSTTLVATNTPASFVFDNLPAGLSQIGGTGEITGTLAAPANHTFSVKANNADGTGPVQTLTLRVRHHPDSPAVSVLADPTGYVGVPFSYQVTVTRTAGSFAAAGLPAGLAINAATGLITGTPTTTGSFACTLQATNPAGTGEPRGVTFMIAPQPDTPEITGSMAEETTALAACSYQIQTRSLLPVTGYTVSGLPDGLSADTGTGHISGAATVTGTFEVKLRASNLIGVGPEAVMHLTVRAGNMVPRITSPASVAVQQGEPLVYQITATNPPVLAWQAEGLPDGMWLDGSSGQIIGKPVVPGTYQAVLRASNVNGAGDPLTLQIQVKPNLAVPVVISPGHFITTKIQAIEMELQVLNMPATRPWIGGLGVFAEGLPDGMTLNSATGVLSGQLADPAALRNLRHWDVGFYAINESGRGATTWATLCYRNDYEVFISGPKQFSATTGQSLDFSLVTDPPCTHSLFSVNGSATFMSQSGGSFSIPASRLPLPGSHLCRIEARADTAWGILEGLTLKVAPAPGAPVIQSAAAFYCQAGSPVTANLAASASPTRYEISHMSPAWPSGLIFDSSLGTFSGTVGQTGAISFLARAYNTAGAGLPKEITMVFAAPSGAPAITTTGVRSRGPMTGPPPPLTAKVGEPFVHRFQATGEVVRFGITGLPEGLAYNENTGEVAGEPAEPGRFNLLVTPVGASVSGQTITTVLVVDPADGSPEITSASTAMAVAGAPFTWQFTASGNPSGFDLGELPDWLAWDRANSTLSGTPAGPGDTRLDVVAFNASGKSLLQEFVVHVAAAADTPVVTPPAGAFAGQVGVEFNAVISASGTVDFFDATTLPFGIALDPQTGLLTGTPVEPGTLKGMTWGVNSHGIGEPLEVTFVISPAAGTPVFVGDPVLRWQAGRPLEHAFLTSPLAAVFAADGLPAGWLFDPLSGLLQATPLAGSYPLQIEAWNTVGSSGKQTFVIQVFADPGELWIAEEFGELADNPAVAGWDADPDHDGIPNLLEYAQGLLAQTAGSSGLPVAAAVGGYLTITYRQNKDATDLTFTPQVSSGLHPEAWSAIGLIETAREDMGSYWLVTVRDSNPTGVNARRFMRLQVSK